MKKLMLTGPGLSLAQSIRSFLSALTNPDGYLSSAISTGKHQDLSQPVNYCSISLK